jgi:hypothetical protein
MDEKKSDNSCQKKYKGHPDLKASDVMKFENMLGSFTVPLSMDLIKKYNAG